MASAQKISGFGYPFAPSNWPGPRDNWEWKTGGQLTGSGEYYRFRTILLPIRVSQELDANGIKVKKTFKSLKSLRDHMTQFYPNLTGDEIETFMKSFKWKIPATEEARRELALKFSAEQERLLQTAFDKVGNLDVLANSITLEEKDDLGKEVDELLKDFNASLELQFAKMKEKIEKQQQKINNLYHAGFVSKDIKKEKLKLEKMGNILKGFCASTSIILEENFKIIDLVCTDS